MYIGKIELIGMIFEIEKPNEDSFQIQFFPQNDVTNPMCFIDSNSP